MTPAQLLNDHVSIEEDFAHVHGVVAADLIVRHALVLAGIGVLKEALPQLELQGGEILIRFISGGISRSGLRLLAAAIIISMVLLDLLLGLLLVLLSLLLLVGCASAGSPRPVGVVVLVGVVTGCVGVDLAVALHEVLVSAPGDLLLLALHRG